MTIRTCLLGCLVGATLASTAAAAEVNVYSARKESLIQPLLDAFTKQTGITVNLLTADADQLVERLKNEGANSPADVLITVDAGRLHRAEADGLLQPVTSPTLEANVPAHLRHPQGLWYGLSQRVRALFVAKDRVKPGDLETYAELATPGWKGRICVRGSGNIYNQSMLAAMIANEGAAAAEQWASGVVANMARKPQGGDRDQIKAVAAGECDVAIANTYYYGGMLSGKDEGERQAAEAVGIVFPDQNGRGAHVNVSGAGVTASARHKGEAVKLLEFLTSTEAQKIYAEVNKEYPVKPGVPLSGMLAGWGAFKADSLNVSALGDNNAAAVMIFDRAGWR